MIYYKTEEEIEKIRKSSLLVGKALAVVAGKIRPGVKTIELDKLAEEFIKDNNALPAFKGYRGFPYTLCISINEQVVHGFPGEREVKDGDIVSVDCGVLKNGYYGDSAYTFAVGEVKPEILLLLKATKESLYLGIENAVEGKRLGDIGFAVQSHVENLGFSVVRDLVGHGVGKNLHEKPEVLNYGKKGTGIKLCSGLVIAIEPMINKGRYQVVQEADGWTIRTADRLPSAHFEHTVAVRKNKADILSSFDEIEKIINKN
ncbi:MAG TPA: type I methionyl aminopeptidase [Bacteroidales bacterium]|nr:type I methionyl aminopeptidase [Bacteroidales bacterium]HPS18233.1 type I methionyl aminopeptidase [Bacteroidales bacterium]